MLLIHEKIFIELQIISIWLKDVNALYEKAISLGATDAGAPGQRATGFYGGYVRDLDGNKLTFCKFG